MRVNIPANPAPNTTVYGEFRGVHLTDPYLCGRSHSPYALNLISNNEGLPEIRPGWKVLHSRSGAVNSIASGELANGEVRLAHIGTKLYKWDEDTIAEINTDALGGLADAKSQIFFAVHENKTKAWILTGAQYLVYDGTTIKNVEEIAKIPVILVGKAPDGGGTPLEGVNLLQPKRTEKFQGNGVKTQYHLSTGGIGSTVTVFVNGSQVTPSNIDTANGIITFSPAPSAPNPTGEDNVFITYSKTIDGYANKIKKCRAVTEYGENGSGRIFLTRNPDYPNYDWWSEINDPTFFPDLNYGIVGGTNTAIMGYAKLGKSLVIIKEDNGQDTTVFLRYPAQTGDTLYFRLDPGITGAGAVAGASFASLVDEPLFLSRTGVFALTSSNITYRETLQNRSYFVDEALTQEPGLSAAIAAEWNGYYLLAINGKVYAFNSRSKEGHGGSFVYNCFLWNNIPATCLHSLEGKLYFGTSDGRICKFNTDIETTAKYNDDDAPIEVVWSTKEDDDGLPGIEKTCLKKGFGITPKPFVRATYRVSIKTEKLNAHKEVMEFNFDILDFEDIDFGRLTFNSASGARFVPIKTKIKKYQTLQIILSAKVKNEAFGVYNIRKDWIPKNYVKRLV